MVLISVSNLFIFLTIASCQPIDFSNLNIYSSISLLKESLLYLLGLNNNGKRNKTEFENNFKEK